MHEGVPPGGALVPELLARANLAVGNAAGAAAIEVFGAIDVALDGTTTVSVDGEVHAPGAGVSFTCAPHPARRVRYLAVAGGLDLPAVLGGRGTLLVAGLGGHHGRLLRRGDVLPCASPPPRTSPVDALPAARAKPPEPDLTAPVRVIPGPDLSRFPASALDELLGGAFRVGTTGDRTGVRLEGPPLARLDRDDGLSCPMMAGAIEVPASGQPIVLGPDHPTTGGYPVLATVVRADLGALFARKPGAELRFARG